MRAWLEYFAARPVHAGWIGAALIALVVCALLRATRARAYASVVFCALLLISRRPGFSALATLAIVGGIIAASKLKYKYMRMNLHAYDLIFFLSDRNATQFFFRNFGGLAVYIMTGVFVSAFAPIAVLLVEPPGISRVAAFVALMAAVVAAPLARGSAAKNVFDLYNPKRPFLAFVDSVMQTLNALRSGGLLATTTTPGDSPRLVATTASAPETLRPSIIVILNESTFPPALYAPIRDDPEIDRFFRSTDGRHHGLRVEAYGGGTWKTEFSVLTGIPTGCYGPFADHVFHWAAEKIHHSLPLFLKRLGYKTAAFDTQGEDFADSNRFFSSVGFDQICNGSAADSSRGRERDAVFYDGALSWIDAKLSDNMYPVFAYIQTIWNHAPHHFTFIDEGGSYRQKKISDSEFDEYIRRLKTCCAEYAQFREELARRFPDRPFVIVHFGDHQPPFTAQGIGGTARAQRNADPEAPYRTFFAIDAVNFDPVVDPELPETIEAAYVGVVALEAAGLPLDAVNAARRELMIRHGGKLFFADDSGEIAAQFNRRMIEAGLITPH